MADVRRSVNTKFWDDSFVAKLQPEEKLLFLYLLTNPLTNVSGIYELPERRIAFDTGLSSEQIRDAFENFKAFDKVYYIDEYVVLVNFLKNQKLNNNMKVSVEKIISELPDSIIKIIWDTPKLLKAFKGFKTLPKIEIESERESEKEIKSEREKEIEIKNSLAKETNEKRTEPDETEDGESYADLDRNFSVLRCFQKHCTDSAFRKVPIVKDAHKEPIKLLWNHFNQNTEQIELIFQKASCSSFLKGGGKSGFKATFEWLIVPENAEKVLSGDYDDSSENEDYHKALKAEAYRCYNSCYGVCRPMQGEIEPFDNCRFCKAMKDRQAVGA